MNWKETVITELGEYHWKERNTIGDERLVVEETIWDIDSLLGKQAEISPSRKERG